MKTAEEWAREIVRLGVSDGEASLSIGFDGLAIELTKLQATAGQAPAALMQQADTLRSFLALVLRTYAERAVAETKTSPPAEIPVARVPETLAVPTNGNGNGHKPARSKGLLGLPCGKCGAYYESDLRQCPFCNPATAEKSAPAEMFTAEPPREGGNGNGNSNGNAAVEVIRAYSFELLQSVANYGARLQQLEASLRISDEEAARRIYELVFPQESKQLPWELCSDDFRSAYRVRAHALLNELRRRAGLEAQEESSPEPAAAIPVIPLRY